MAGLDRIEPIPEFSFAVEIEGMVVGWFTECSNLTIEREVIPQPQGGVNNFIPQLPGPVKWANVTLKRGLAGPELWTWFEQGRYDGQIKRRRVTIILYKVDRTEGQRWELNNAFPVKWSTADFNSDTNQVFLETLELACGGGQGQSTVQRVLNSPTTGQETAPGHDTEAGVDLPGLAEAVYTLLKQELKIEQDRLGRSRY
jgi:phage tail-like protein